MQVRVISLKEPAALLKEAKRIFPSADVARQRGVDVRSATVDNLYHSGLITRTAGHALTDGRKYHHELSSQGAVGLAHAVRFALEADTTKPLLLLEDDCVFADIVALRRDVEVLLQHIDEFDLAVFGASVYRSHPTDASQVNFLPDNWKHLDQGFFWKCHCVLYSPRGRARIADHLRTHPLDMQIDGLYSSLATFGELDVLLQLRAHSAIQRVHYSSVQSMNTYCVLCAINHRDAFLAAISALLMVCVILVAAPRMVSKLRR